MINFRDNKGVAILISLLIVAVILSVVLALSAIFIPKIQIASETKNSVPGAYAAESALEWCLYVNRAAPVPPPVMNNGSTYTVTDCAASPVRAVGTYRNVSRMFEITF